MKKIVNLFLTILMFLSCVPYVQASTDISQGANKGDLRLGTYIAANKNKVSVVKTDDNGVTVKKEVTKNSAGNYDVEFFVSGPTTTATTQIKIPVYVVFVIDRSYSMRLESDNGKSRWANAEEAAIDISAKFNLLGVNMAAVGFSGGRNRSEANGGDNIAYNDTVDIRDVFSTAPITNFGDYDTNHNTGGGTNMYAGLKRAQELLKDKTGLKHIILLTDGVPTFYYDENGYSKGAGNSNSDERIVQVPNVVEKTKEIAKAVEKDGITIHTIGYHFDKLTYVHSSNSSLNERALAQDTLSNVASSSSNYHIVNSYEETNLSIEFNNIKDDISTVSIANNPVITDGIGNSFKLSGTNTYGGSKELKKNNFGVTSLPTSLGKFSIQINSDSPTGWYKTNNSFTFSYTHATKGVQTITISENPEVFWAQPVPYTIYHVEKDNINNVLKIENGSGEYNTSVSVNEKTFTGYNYDSKSKEKVILKDSGNVAYVYYTKKAYNYKINYYYDGVIDEGKTETKSALYNTEITNYPDKNITGYKLEKVTTNDDDKSIPLTISEDNNKNVINVYYIKDKFNYRVEYYYDGKIDDELTYKNSAYYNDVITSYPLNEKKGFSYVETKNAPLKVAANEKENVIKVYYESNNYNYIINHFEKGNIENIFEIEQGEAKYNSLVDVNKKDFAGFTYDSQDWEQILINTENNVANICYKRNMYSYKVEHYKENLEGKYNLVEEDTVIYSALYESDVTFDINDYEGYTYNENKTENITLKVPANNDLVIRLYYDLNESKAIVHHVVKQGDYYYSFKDFGTQDDNLLSFENVNLEDDIFKGKIGMLFEANKRIVPDYYLSAVYLGNILTHDNVTLLELTTIKDRLEPDTKEYTYVYEIILGEGDGSEDIILPPQTGYENNYSIMSYLLFICACYLLIRKRIN